MAKENKTERTVYCSGIGWEGDGSKESSTCGFHDSMKATATRYQCSHCTTKQTPADIFAGPGGIKPATKKALGIPDATSEEPAPVEEVPVEVLSSPEVEKTFTQGIEEFEAGKIAPNADVAPAAEETKDEPKKTKAPKKSKKRRKRF